MSPNCRAFAGGRLKLVLVVAAFAAAPRRPATTMATEPAAPAAITTAAIAHRGLLRHSPENTLPNFAACLQLRMGFEFDVRRGADGALVCIHDDTLDRTTDGRGPVSARTLAELQRLDAGSWFAAEFRDVRIPTIDQVLQQIAAHPEFRGVCAVDLKADDARLEPDVVALARRHGVVDRLLFIGRAIEHRDVRRRLRIADPGCHVAALANREDELAAAIDAADADWVYVRFVPTAEQTAKIRAAGKRTIIAGATVANLSPDNWKRAADAAVDAVLTDYPLELRSLVVASRRAAW